MRNLLFFFRFTYYQQSFLSFTNIDSFPVNINAPSLVTRF